MKIKPDKIKSAKHSAPKLLLRTKEALFSRAYKVSHITGVLLIPLFGTKQNYLSRYISLPCTQLMLIFKVMEIT